MINVDSIESEKLKKLIEGKKKYLQKQTNKTAAQFLQEEIIFLQNSILPVVQANTTILYYECSKSFVRAVDMAMKLKSNGLLYYLPIHSEYKDEPSVAIFNSKQFEPVGTPGNVLVEVVNMDFGGSPIKPVNLNINALM